MHKILIVDDSPVVLSLMKKILSSAGYDVSVIEESTTFFDGHPEVFDPGLVIIDINMPGADGFYLLENIKEKNLLPDAKIMMCSSKHFEHDIEKTKNLGADDFLVKPFKKEDLLSKVSELLV